MSPPESHQPDRREFLRGAARYAALGGIAALIAAGARRGSIERAGCTRARFCQSCAQFAGCDQEQAQSTRRATTATRGSS